MSSLMHYGKKGMKWGVRNEDKKSSSSTPKEMSVTTKAVLNKAVIARQDAKKELDRTTANLKAHGTKDGKTGDKVNTGIRLAEGALRGAANGGARDGGLAVGLGSHAAYALYESTERGKKAAVKNAKISYENALAKEARIREGKRSLLEKALDWSDLSAVDIMTAQNYTVKDD